MIDETYSDETFKTQGVPRSGAWPALVHRLMNEHPYCAACGVTALELSTNGAGHLIGHHKVPFHLDATLELDPSNIIILCESWGYRCCHNFIGHLGDKRWLLSNPDVELHSSMILATMKKVKGL